MPKQYGKYLKIKKLITNEIRFSEGKSRTLKIKKLPSLKMIIRNLVLLQNLQFFVSKFRSWDIHFFTIQTISSTSKVMTSWWVLKYRIKPIFWLYLPNHSSKVAYHFVMKLSQLTYSQGNIFLEIFCMIWEAGS